MKSKIITALLLSSIVAACEQRVVQPDGNKASIAQMPAQMDIVTGNNQIGEPGEMLPEPLVVRVLDSNGNPVPNQVVNFHVVSGGGDTFAGVGVTNGSGIAKERWILGEDSTQQQRLEARAVDVSSGEPQTYAVFTATFGAPPPPPPAPVASVTVTPPADTIHPAWTTQLTATARDANGNVLTGRPTTWTSLNTGIATVNSSGRVTGVAVGVARVVATIESRADTSVITIVSAPVASVTVTPAADTVNFGGTVQLNATARDANGNVLTGRTTTWTTSNSIVATVDSNGRVTGRAPGNVVITATIESQSDTAAIRVDLIGGLKVRPPDSQKPPGSSGP